MLTLLATLSLVVLAAGRDVTHKPTSRTAPSEATAIDCTNITSGISSTCYTTLNLTAYFVDWNTTYRLETCSPLQLWSNCLLNYIYANNTRTTYTSANITHNDCSTLPATLFPASTNNVTCPLPSPQQKPWTPQEFYTALTIFNVHAHITSWAKNISMSEPQARIESVVDGATVQSPTAVLQGLIAQTKNHTAADQALIEALNTPSPRPVAAAGGAVTGALGSVASTENVGGVPGLPAGGAEEWVPLLVGRLGEVLGTVMRDFDGFLGLVDGGAYSGSDLTKEGLP